MVLQCNFSAGSDGREIDTEWMLRQFNNDLCPALKVRDAAKRLFFSGPASKALLPPPLSGRATKKTLLQLPSERREGYA